MVCWFINKNIRHVNNTHEPSNGNVVNNRHRMSVRNEVRSNVKDSGTDEDKTSKGKEFYRQSLLFLGEPEGILEVRH